MIRAFVRGYEVQAQHEGESVRLWLPDEDGALRAAGRSAEHRQALPGAGLTRQPISDTDIEALDWQCELDARMHLDRINRAAQESVEWGDLQGAMVELGAGVRAATESLALGLVSVLSTHPAGKKWAGGVKPLRSFRVTAERAAAVQAAGAFVCGGDEARMAKLRMAVGFTARAHAAARKGHRPDEVRMVTLTYAEGNEWQAMHIASLMDRFRKWHVKRGLKMRYVWVAEIQDGSRRADKVGRGAVHYHCAFWVPVGTAHFPKADNEGWWPHGSTRTELANGAVQYLMHYLKKGNSKNFGAFPDGCRIYSVGGLDHSLRRARRWLGLPGFVRGNSSLSDDWKRAPTGSGGGWIAPDSTHWPSEFRRVNCGGVQALQRVHTHARTIDANGPFSWLTDKPALAVLGEVNA
jgi:hypothetical protein